MALPMSRPIKLKNGVYYLQKRVPVDLLDKVGRKTIKVSLFTKDPMAAKIRHAQKLQELDTEWASLRSDVLTLSFKQVVALTKQRYDFFLAQFGDNPPSVASTQNELDMRKGVDQDAERLEIWYGRTADTILLAHGIRVDLGTRHTLLRQIHSTDIQSLELIKRNAEGNFSPDPMADRFPEWVPEKTVVALPVEASLSHLFDLWEKDHKADNGATRTASDFAHKVRSLIAFLKYDDAARVTPLEISKWCDCLRHEKGLSGKTIRDKYLSAVKAVVRTGMNKQIIVSDPTKGVVVKVSKQQKLRSKGYTDTEALDILRHAKQPFRADSRRSAGNKRAIRWLPWICAFTGARSGEIAQLRKEDLIDQDGIKCLKITPEAGSVKTGNVRLVPIHPQLIEQGLLAFIQNSPKGHLFFDLDPKNPDPQKRASSAYKKVGGWIRDTVGIVDPSVQPNHAWRHRFKTISRDYGLGSEYSEAIMGHEDGKAATSCGEIGPKALYREIIKLPHIELAGKP